jgi:predicted  nucleic acid-binding Zn-ribbon protein
MAKAKFDIKTEATRPLYAYVGVTDLAVETVREYVAGAQTRFADVQKNVSGFDYSPQALRQQVNARVEALSKDAKARRAAAEARVAELRKEATTRVNENADTATDAYGGLVKRGETLVARIRRQESTKRTASSAKTASTKAKTTTTQAKKTAKKSTSTAKKTAKKSPAKSSAKATGTAAKNTASNAAQATSDAASKVGN